jgi:hypothetical protein
VEEGFLSAKDQPMVIEFQRYLYQTGLHKHNPVKIEIYLNMKYFFKRIVFKLYLNSHIIILWLFWYPRYYFKIKEIKGTLNFLNNEITSFSTEFPYLNSKSFIKQSKYWQHWIRKMDPREKLHFKEWNPIILINEEAWIHLDMSKREIPIIDYSFYCPDSEWVSTTIFDSLYELQHYLAHNNNSAKDFISMVKQIVSSKTWARKKNKAIIKIDESFFIDENGDIGLSPEYLEKTQKKFREYRKIHPKR